MYTLYMHEFPDGKKYIGVTSKKPDERFGKNGILYKRNTKFFEEIQRVGWENIEHKILCTVDTLEDAKKKEIELISFYKSNLQEYGFNTEKGGTIHAHSDETKRKMSEKRKGVKPSDEHRKALSKSLKGKTVSEDSKRKMSQARSGKALSKEHKKHISESCKGKGTKAVIQMDMQGNVLNVFQSMKEAGKAINPSGRYGNISTCCKGDRQSAYGYKWKYA